MTETTDNIQPTQEQEPQIAAVPDFLDIVIPYVYSTVVWQELRYALRSIEKNVKFPHRIFLVADKFPEWANKENLHLVKVEQFKGIPFSKAFDQWRKIMAVINDERISERFVYAYDDQLWLKKIDSDFFDTIYSSPRVKTLADLNKTVPSAGANWRTIFMHSVDILRKNGKPTYNYEIHIPRLLEKARVKTLIETYGITERSATVLSTLYFNTFFTGQPEDVSGVRAVIKEKKNSNFLQTLLNKRNVFFADYNNEGLNVDLRNYIQKKYPNPSAYEL